MPPPRLVLDSLPSLEDTKVKVKVTQSCPTLCDSMDFTVHGILQARILEWVAFPFCRNLSNPGTAPRSPALQADSLPAEPQGKPKNTGIGSLSLLQQIFPTQESNWGLLHCRRILHQGRGLKSRSTDHWPLSRDTATWANHNSKISALCQSNQFYK